MKTEAHSLNRLCNGRIGISCQIHPDSTAALNSLFQLLGTHYHFASVNLCKGCEACICIKILRFHTV